MSEPSSSSASRIATATYDPAGRKSLTINARGQTVTHSYDAVGRYTASVYPDGKRTTHAYDPVGNRTLLADSTGLTTTTYDQLSQRSSQVTSFGRQVGYNYDPAQRRSSLVDPQNKRFTYTYDAAGQLTQVINPRSERTTLGYDPAGRQTLKQTLGGATQQDFDPADRLVGIQNTRGAGIAVNRFTYTYDRTGSKTAVVESASVRSTWVYDRTHQLKQEQRGGFSGTFNVAYSYDAAGNRITQVDSGQVTTYLYDAANQLLRSESASQVVSYAYDEDGNRVRREGASDLTVYDWDADNRLTRAEPTAGTINLRYNGDGQRVEKETPAEVTRYLYDYKKLLQEMDAENDVQRFYTSTQEEYGDLVSQWDEAEGSQYHQYDGQWSTDALLDETQAVAARYAHRAFGLQALHTGTADTRFTYVGQQGYYKDDELDLYLLGAGNNGRYYDPAAARFLSTDPLGHADDPQNLYRYVKNDPLNYKDPSGWGTGTTPAAPAGAALPASRCDPNGNSNAADNSASTQGAGQAGAGESEQRKGSWWVEKACCWIARTLQISGFCPSIFKVATNIDSLMKTTASEMFSGITPTLAAKAEAFLQGAKDGFTRFKDQGFSIFPKWLARKLNISVEVFEGLGNGDPMAVAGGILKSLCLTWDDIIAKIDDALPGVSGVLLTVIEEIYSVIESNKGPVDWFMKKVGSILEFFERIEETIAEMATEIFTNVMTNVIKKIVPKLVVDIIAMINPASAIYPVLKAVYNAVVWIIKNKDKIIKIFGTIQQAWLIATGANSAIAGRVAALVFDRLTTFVDVVLDLISRLLGINNFLDVIRDAIAKVRDLIHKPIDKVIKAVAKFFKGIVEKLLTRLGLHDQTLVNPDKVAKIDGTLMTTDSGKIKLKYNPTDSVQDYLEDRRNSDPPPTPEIRTKIDAAQTALAALVAGTAALKAELEKKKSRGILARIVQLGKEVRRLQKELAKKLADLGCPPKESKCKGIARGAARTFLTGLSIQSAVAGVRFYPIKRVIANLQRGSGTHVSDAARAVLAPPVGNAGDDGGHIVGKQFGGLGEIGNLFPENPNSNRAIQRTLEGRVARLEPSAPDDPDLCVQYTLEYGTPIARPEKIVITVFLGADEQFEQPIRNP